MPGIAPSPEDELGRLDAKKLFCRSISRSDANRNLFSPDGVITTDKIALVWSNKVEALGCAVEEMRFGLKVGLLLAGLFVKALAAETSLSGNEFFEAKIRPRGGRPVSNHRTRIETPEPPQGD